MWLVLCAGALIPFIVALNGFCPPAYFLWCAQSLSWLSVTLCTVAHQVLLFMEFSRQGYWSGLPFPPPTASGTQTYGTATIWNSESHCKEKKSSEGSQTCNFMLQPCASIHLSSQFTWGSNPIAPPSEKEAGELNTTVRPEISGKPHVRWDFVISLYDVFSISHDSKSNWLHI